MDECTRIYTSDPARRRRCCRCRRRRAVRACASRVGEGIVTEMLTSWNYFLLSVAKFIGTSRREERG